MPNRRGSREEAVRHLRANDQVLREVIDAVGAFCLKLETNRFGMLVRSVISQQLSTSAARAIRLRVESLVPAPMSPQFLAQVPITKLQAVGVSKPKALCVSEIAHRACDGRVNLDKYSKYSDVKILDELTDIKGIGVWTVHMFLMFSLGRLDVLPHGDLGVRSAMRDLYGLNGLPSKNECHAIAERWRPFSSVASWYCWRSIDLKRKLPTSSTGYPC